MKKIAIVWSSPNSGGLTASAKDQIRKGLADAGAEVTEIHLNKKKLEHCRACGNGWGTCSTNGTCVIRDDYAEIYRTLTEADGIVWISAVYWWDMTECVNLPRLKSRASLRHKATQDALRYRNANLLGSRSC